MDNNNNNFSNTLGLASFVLGIMNLQENLTQNDKQELLDQFNKKSKFLLSEIHSHLEKQDQFLKELSIHLEQQDEQIKQINQKFNQQEELLEQLIKKLNN